MTQQEFKPSSNVTISLSEAQSRIQDWRNYIGPNLDTKAFFLSVDDLKTLGDVLNTIDNPIGVRAYLARNEQQENGLVLVAVSGTDLNNQTLPNGRDIVLANNGDSLICDFTTPCPTMCDAVSPLNNIPVALK